MTVTRPVPEVDGLEDPELSESEETEVDETVPVKVIWESSAEEVDDPVISDSGAEEVVVAATEVVDEAAAPKPARKLGE